MTSPSDRDIKIPRGDRIVVESAPGGAFVLWERGRGEHRKVLFRGVAASPNHAAQVVKELLRLSDPIEPQDSSSEASSAGGQG